MGSLAKKCFDTVEIKVSWNKFKKKMGVNQLGRQQIRSTLQRNTVTERDRETSGYLESNADQACCFKMKKNTAVFNINDNASVKWMMQKRTVGSSTRVGQRGQNIMHKKGGAPEKTYIIGLLLHLFNKYLSKQWLC